jgi:catechol 2,3-dioxygenase
MTTIDPALRIRLVRLAVADLATSADFYERVLGLPLLDRADDRALLGTDSGDPALELVPQPGARPAPPRSTGLFHVAWLHPSREALADTVRRIAAARWPFTGASDHGVSEALYLDDPDGLGIEVYADRPMEQWGRLPGGGYEIYTAPLDLDDLMAADTHGPSPRMAPGTGIGHVHLKVTDVDAAERFYQRLGFEQQARIPQAAFVSAGGYHHHVGLNSWQSAGAQHAPPESPGLRLVAFELSGEEAVEAVAGAAGDAAGPRAPAPGDEHGAGAATAREGELLVSDPDGETLSFAARG